MLGAWLMRNSNNRPTRKSQGTVFWLEDGGSRVTEIQCSYWVFENGDWSSMIGVGPSERRENLENGMWSELINAEKLDPRQVVTFEELVWSMMYEQAATRRVLLRKGAEGSMSSLAWAVRLEFDARDQS